MKKCMEFRVEGRRPVRRPIRTWLESVEADIAEVEIDKEDVHDINKLRRNVMKQTSSPDITTVSNTLCNRTSWTTQHALSSDHLPIITTINIRHDYRLQHNQRTFTNYR